MVQVLMQVTPDTLPQTAPFPCLPQSTQQSLALLLNENGFGALWPFITAVPDVLNSFLRLHTRNASHSASAVCRCGGHLALYEDGLKGRTDNSKNLVKHNHMVAREEFTSNKLTPKLAQQLKV